jgi:hypothetical protein
MFTGFLLFERFAPFAFRDVRSKSSNMNSNQPNYADGAQNFAKPRPLQLTLRVMQDIFSNPKYWLGFVAVIAILTIMGPFGTLEEMTFAPRLVYWAAISLITFPVGMASSIFFGTLTHQKGVPEGLSRILGGIAGGIPIGIIVFLVNMLFFDNGIGSVADLTRLTGYTIVISTAVSILYYLIESSMRSHVAEATVTMPITRSVVETRPEPAFFKRLPVDLGKDIIFLQAQDHYVKVTTIKGSEMILLRLGDAEQELAELDGTRVHRSWWISRRHVADFKRENEKWTITLSTGEKVPVSRSYLKQARELFGR